MTPTESPVKDCGPENFACTNAKTGLIERCIAKAWVCDGEVL